MDAQTYTCFVFFVIRVLTVPHRIPTFFTCFALHGLPFFARELTTLYWKPITDFSKLSCAESKSFETFRSLV